MYTVTTINPEDYNLKKTLWIYNLQGFCKVKHHHIADTTPKYHRCHRRNVKFCSSKQVEIFHFVNKIFVIIFLLQLF